MLIAIPIKMNKKDAAVAPLFGKAKWFALIKDAEITIEANPCHGGKAVVDWLSDIGVNKLIIQEMGKSPYMKLKSYGDIELYHTGYGRNLIQEVLEKFKNNQLSKIDDSNIAEIIKHHEKKHPHHEHAH